VPCPKAIHHSSSSLTSNTDMQQGPKQAYTCDSPAIRVNKPWVQKYSTRLTWRKRGWRTLEMQVLGQGKDVARFKSSLPKAYYSWSYFRVLPLSPFSSLSQLSVHFPYSNPSHSILFSCFSNSPVLHCFCNEISLHIHGASAIRIDSSPS
jgi:hypothetical protein